MAQNEHPKRGRLKMLLLAGLFLAPVVGAYLLYGSGWRPDHTGNYGELIQPARPIADVTVQTLAGEQFGTHDLRGKWTLIYFGPAECLKPCTANLYKMHQIHMAQGKEAKRIRRVFVVTDPRSLDLLRNTIKDYPGTEVIHGSSATIESLARQFVVPAGSPLENLHRIYLIDPLGNFMMSYPADADPTGIRKDVTRLLKVSQIG